MHERLIYASKEKLAFSSWPDITYSVKKLLKANCYLIYAYRIALKYLLRYLRSYLRFYSQVYNLPCKRPYYVEIEALNNRYNEFYKG
ncbi:hypothetical protein L249_7670 [Ophiocordyceps polyrhachis-furcata BCC 54312]|uniref:Uncharacterized protein n=1 Tax=Ophiocordyceps polyrhachis-furcata BCC 54312 TaxID=1330021 RepID=A0A367LBG6_9HYPO|nr:hypothetical protein L249_7670 [Ophiocordyceps polyrhachis-furcata BCC 54312]